MTYRLTARITAGGFTVRGPLGATAWDTDLARAVETVAILVRSHPRGIYFQEPCK